MSIENRIKELLGESQEIDESAGIDYKKVGKHTGEYVDLYSNSHLRGTHKQNEEMIDLAKAKIADASNNVYAHHIGNYAKHSIKHAFADIDDDDAKKTKFHKNEAEKHMKAAVKHLQKNGATDNDLIKTADHYHKTLGDEETEARCYNGQCNAMHDAHKALSSKKTNESVDEDMNILEEDAVGKVKIEDAIKEKHPGASIKWEENNWRAYMGTQEVGSGQYIPSKFGAANESIKIDVTDDINALVEGEELSEEFITKATTIFEAAVVTRVKQELARLEEEFDERVETTSGQLHEALVEKIDGYLDYTVEQWVEQNEVAIEAGIKNSITENFIEGLKNLFKENYIEIPEEKFDLLGSLEEKVDTLSAKLTESTDIILEQRKELDDIKKQNIFNSISEGLALTEVEKFKTLVDELEYVNEEVFTDKVNTLKTSYFSKKPKTIVESVVTDNLLLTEEIEVSEITDPAMKQYVNLFNK